MLNNYYQLYVSDTYRLAETIVIKFTDAATALNYKVISDHGLTAVDTQDPLSWKYYQNISGTYHFTDTPIQIVSLDTQEMIVFNKENLVLHPATNLAYQYDNRHYRELIQNHPDQELLILGILYPADISAAVAAPEGTILAYPKELVESNEYTFISKVQNWIYTYLDRWVNRPFSNSDDLYACTYMAQLYIQLVPLFINTRLRASRTNEAHSYHIREYLTSHSALAEFMDVMTKEQQLYFVRNILYIQKNAGKKDTFDWLVENVFTKRKLPVYDFTMKHNLSEMLGTAASISLNDPTVKYHPIIEFQRKAINFTENNILSVNQTLEQMLIKLNPTATQNEPYNQTYLEEFRSQFEDSKSNVVLTKVIESSVVDHSDTVPYKLMEVLINHWMHWSITGKYDAMITMIMPKTKSTIIISAKNAFILYYYCMARAVGKTPSKLPEVLAVRVLKTNLPTVAELMNSVDSKYTTLSQVQDIVSLVPTVGTLLHSQAFYTAGHNVYRGTVRQHNYYCNMENGYTSGDLFRTATALYCDAVLKTSDTEVFYSQWLRENSFDLVGYTDLEFYELATQAMMASTGLDDNQTTSLKRIQKAMIDIFSRLSSYSIDVISNVEQAAVDLISTSSIRLMQYDATDAQVQNIETDIISVKYFAQKDYHVDRVDITQYPPQAYIPNPDTDTNPVDVRLLTDFTSDEVFAPVMIEQTNIFIKSTPDFYEEYAALTTAQKRELFAIA